MKVTLYVREHSSRKYTKATKKFYEPGTVFVLRYRSTWETIGAIPLADANRKLLTRSLELMNGVVPNPKPRPEPSVLMLDRAVDQYLDEVKNGRKKKTYQAYDVALRYFYECVGNKPIKDFGGETGRGDMLKFATFLRECKKQSARSCWNKFSNVMSFLKHHDVKPKIKAHDWPKFVEEEPEIYEQETLDKFFAACDADELLLFEFFLMTGMREQEVIYATDRCIDFENSTISVRHNPKYGWTPKQYKEGSMAQFVGKRAVENGAPRKSPKAELSRCA
ncbi:MAG TPA: hypothetical protein VIX37_17215 [Candidatus Sulfotelmatobacter sp.]